MMMMTFVCVARWLCVCLRVYVLSSSKFSWLHSIFGKCTSFSVVPFTLIYFCCWHLIRLESLFSIETEYGTHFRNLKGLYFFFLNGSICVCLHRLHSDYFDLFTQHSDHYLVHHFQFECNDGKVFGNYVGNWTLNKFMSLHDWHQIFISLNTPIQHYIAKPTKRPTQTKQHIGDTNFELNIAWVKMDASIYSKLFTGIDFSLVFPYVIKVRVSLRSNVDKFRDGVDVSLESQAHEAVATTATAGTTDTTSNRQRTLKRSAVQPSVQEPSKPANGPARTPIELRECCVRLPLLQFDENGQVIQAPETNQQQQPPPQPVRNSKRKFSSIANVSQINSMNLTPIRNGGENSGFGAICAADTSHCFQASSSSTPFIRKVNGGINGSGSAKQKRQRMPPTQRLTMSTPVSSQDRKTGSTQFNPRIRLLKMPENVSKLNISAKNSKRKIRGPDKKSTKINGKTKTASGKVIKKKKKKVIRVIPNESQLFETPPPPPNRMSKKVVASANAADASAVVIISPLSSTETTPTTPAKETNNDNEEMTIIPCNGTVKAEYL